MRSATALPPRRPDSRFFRVAPFLMLAIVVAGFTATFFGRAFFNVQPIAGYLYLHGAAMTLWFVLLPMQAWLIRNGGYQLHRKLGWTAAVLVVLIPVTATIAQLSAPARLSAMLGDAEQLLRSMEMPFWGNWGSMLNFIICVSAALWFRGYASTHKRLMIFASIGLLPPAAARIARWSIFSPGADLSMPNALEPVFATSVAIVLPLLLLLHDWRTRGKPHRATLVGFALLIVLGAVLPGMLANSALGDAVFERWIQSGRPVEQALSYGVLPTSLPR